MEAALPTEIQETRNDIPICPEDVPVPCTPHPQTPCEDKSVPQAAPLEMPPQDAPNSSELVGEATVTKPNAPTRSTYPQRERCLLDRFCPTFLK